MKDYNDAVIMAGGSFNDKDKVRFGKGISQLRDPLFIAADKGISYMNDLGISPDFWIGDFDSADDSTTEEDIAKVKSQGGQIIKLNPVKDDTDTEAALDLAMKNSKGSIYIFAGLGGRTDHALSNIHILKKALDCGRKAILLSYRERIRLTDDRLVIKKSEQYGNYVSVFPFSTEASGVDIEGMKYSLSDATFSYGTSLGQSNEIVDEEGIITVKDGILLVIESLG